MSAADCPPRGRAVLGSQLAEPHGWVLTEACCHVRGVRARTSYEVVCGIARSRSLIGWAIMERSCQGPGRADIPDVHERPAVHLEGFGVA